MPSPLAESHADYQDLPQFVIGQLYTRSKDITGKYGGTGQGGIAPSRRVPAIFLFSGESGKRYGYSDHFDDSGTLFYVGEGRRGDMTMKGGNRAIVEHAAGGRPLHVFQTTGKGKPCVYTGEFVYDSFSIERGPDEEGNERDLIVFRLVPISQTLAQEIGGGDDQSEGNAENAPKESDLPSLRKAAIAACLPDARSVLPTESVRTTYQRSAQVKRYVLARAGGRCELCGATAPFKRKSDGTPYLEPHHINRVSDGGLDHPSYVGAICPTCHRSIHFGQDGYEQNEKLRRTVAEIEAQVAAADRPSRASKRIRPSED